MDKITTLIREKIKEIEAEKGVKVLFVVENGSRVWRMNSADSDYDVRFLYYYPVNQYLKLRKPVDVITAHFDKEGNKCVAQGCEIDMLGFDLFKFTKMLSSSNPTVIEWLVSDIIYYGKSPEVFVEYARKCFNPVSLYFHYKSMARQNYIKYIKSGNLVTYKKYLYSMRGCVNAKWISQFEDYKLPPINFAETLTRLLQIAIDNPDTAPVSEDVILKLVEIIKLKKSGREKEIIQNIVKIDNYIENFLKNEQEAPPKKKYAVDTDLDKEIQRILFCEN